MFDAGDSATSDPDTDGLRGLLNAKLYNPAVAFNPAAPTQFGTVTITSVNADIDDLHVLAMDANGKPTHFIVGFDGDLDLSGNRAGNTGDGSAANKFNNTQLLEVRVDNAGNFWVNALPYFDSGTNLSGGNDGDDLDAFALVEDLPAPTALGETIFANNDGADIPEWLLLLNDVGAVDTQDGAVVEVRAASLRLRTRMAAGEAASTTSTIPAPRAARSTTGPRTRLASLVRWVA